VSSLRTMPRTLRMLTKAITGAAILLIGVWLMLDGIVSIVIYWPQHWYEHAIRIVRIILGIILAQIGDMIYMGCLE
jgi:hypothetical protein